MSPSRLAQIRPPPHFQRGQVLRFGGNPGFPGTSASPEYPGKPADPASADVSPPFEEGGQGARNGRCLHTTGVRAVERPRRWRGPGIAKRFAPLTFLRDLALALALACLHAPIFAQVATNAAPLQFRDAAEEQRFHSLTSELRCVMCQNQSLADSNAQIAHDLRAEVLQLMRQGRSDAQIKQFLVQRYGQFVLYRPQVEAGTWLLWFGPLLLLVGGGFVVARIVRRRAQATPPAGDDPQEW